MNRTIRFFSLFSMLVLTLLTTSFAQAQSYYYRWSAAPAFICSPGVGGTVSVVFASQPVEWHLPATGATFTITYWTGSVANPTGPFPAGSGDGSFTYGPLWMQGGTSPVTYSVQMGTLIDGNPSYTSTMSATCATDTSSGTSSITNGPLSTVPTLDVYGMVLMFALLGLIAWRIRRHGRSI
jgi:hypothetical protein